MNWGVVVSALLTLLILIIREHMKTKILVLALIVEFELHAQMDQVNCQKIN